MRLPRLVVLIDGGCPLCRRIARRLHSLDWFNRLAFVDATDPIARNTWAPDLDEAAAMREMYVVDDAGECHAGYDGYVQIAGVAPLLWPFRLIGLLPGVRQAGRAAYRFIAARRTRDGRCTDDLCVAHSTRARQ